MQHEISAENSKNARFISVFKIRKKKLKHGKTHVCYACLLFFGKTHIKDALVHDSKGHIMNSYILDLYLKIVRKMTFSRQKIVELDLYKNVKIN